MEIKGGSNPSKSCKERLHSAYQTVQYNSRKIRLIEVNAKCRHLKNWHVKGLCGRCLLNGDSQFLAYIQSSRYLKPSFKICTLPIAPLPFSLVQLSPLPCVKNYTVHMYIVHYTLWAGWYGVLLDSKLYRSYSLCIWPDSEPTKLQDLPKQKPGRRGGLRRIKTCRKVLLQVDFF